MWALRELNAEHGSIIHEPIAAVLSGGLNNLRRRVIYARSDRGERVTNHSAGAEEGAACVSRLGDPVSYEDEQV